MSFSINSGAKVLLFSLLAIFGGCQSDELQEIADEWSFAADEKTFRRFWQQKKCYRNRRNGFYHNDLIMMRHIQSNLLELVKRSFRLLYLRWNRKT